MKGTSAQEPRGIHGIFVRMEVLIITAVAAPMLLFGWAAWSSLNGLRSRLLDERRSVAQSVAHHVDRTIRDNLELLAAVPPAHFAGGDEADSAASRAALRNSYLRSRLFEAVLLVDAGGAVVWGEPLHGNTYGFDLARVPEAREALQSGRPVVSAPAIAGSGPRRVYAVVPLGIWEGHFDSFAVGVWDIGSPAWTERLETGYLAPEASLEVVDRHGTVLLSSAPARRFQPSDFATEIPGLLADRIATVRELQSRGERAEVVALAPLPAGRWAVIVREPSTAFFGPVSGLLRRLVLIGAAVLLCAVFFAWGISRSVEQPLARLTEATERIAAGDIHHAVNARGNDELGRLGRSFEIMRRNLEETLARLETSNQEMERRVEERTRELQKLYRELDLHDRMRGQLLRKVIHAQEEERKRLARELHDETCQTITALAVGIDTALCAESPEVARQRLDDVKGMATRTLDELHRVIFDLRPSILDDLGLVPALRWYAQRHLAPRGIQVRFESEEIETRLPSEIEIALFRAAQESLNNVARHADADTVLVQIGAEGGVLQIEIEDDGRGFEVAEVADPSESGRGLGILGIRERLELLGGSARVESSTGQGTRVTLRVPIPEESNVV